MKSIPNTERSVSEESLEEKERIASLEGYVKGLRRFQDFMDYYFPNTCQWCDAHQNCGTARSCEVHRKESHVRI